jgi:quercetin dioxygenase-like cupin family protein
VHKFKVVRPGEGECVWMTGNQYTFHAVAEDTNGTYTLFEGVVPPGAGPPPHAHSREIEAIYVLEGELTFYVENESFQLGPGCLINLPRGVVHSFKNQGTETARMLDLVVPSGMENFIRETGRPVVDRSGRPAVVTPEDVERVTTIAPKYGIEIVVRNSDPDF